MKKSHFWILAWAILIFCPLVPIVLTLAYIWTKNEDIHHKARLSKCLAGFLDHGPHFVLRLVIVVLIGISHSGVYKRYVKNGDRFKCFILNIFQGWFYLHFLNGNKLPSIHPNSSHLQWTKGQCCKMVVPLWSHVLCNICMQVRLFPVMWLSQLWVTTFFRAFTLAVFLKETLHNEKTDAPWAFFILLIMLSFNIGLFR